MAELLHCQERLDVQLSSTFPLSSVDLDSFMSSLSPSVSVITNFSFNYTYTYMYKINKVIIHVDHYNSQLYTIVNSEIENLFAKLYQQPPVVIIGASL